MSFYLVKSRISVLFEVTLIPYVNNPNVRTILQKTKLFKRQDKQFLNKKSRFKLKGGQTTTRYNEHKFIHALSICSTLEQDNDDKLSLQHKNYIYTQGSG